MTIRERLYFIALHSFGLGMLTAAILLPIPMCYRLFMFIPIVIVTLLTWHNIKSLLAETGAK